MPTATKKSASRAKAANGGIVHIGQHIFRGDGAEGVIVGIDTQKGTMQVKLVSSGEVVPALLSNVNSSTPGDEKQPFVGHTDEDLMQALAQCGADSGGGDDESDI